DCKSAASSFGGSNPSLPTEELQSYECSSFYFSIVPERVFPRTFVTWHIFCNFVKQNHPIKKRRK
ncbi:hypothetical protein, partial [Prevotella denticola]|uniref:hypothetical protein n=1 Tax=Prevotella denticola TaxID=28129 RepID=UPI00241E645F